MACCCSLAGTAACDVCRNRPSVFVTGTTVTTPTLLVTYVPERTCRIVKSSRKYVLSDGTELFEDGCSECNGYVGEGDNYCPNCGAKVIRE